MLDEILSLLDWKSVLVFLLVLCLTEFIYAYLTTPSDIPPFVGRRIPVLGHLHHISNTDKIVDKFIDWGKQKKPFLSMYFGKHLGVLAMNYDAIREVWINHDIEFMDRPDDFFSKEIARFRGIVQSTGKVWQEQRRFALHVLRDFGMGKSILENRIHEESNYLIEHFEKNELKLEDMKLVDAINRAVSNIICQLVFGVRYAYDDPEATKRQEYFRVVTNFSLLGDMLPFLRHLPCDITGLNKILRAVSDMRKFYKKEMADHRKTVDENNVRDFIDAYILEISKHVDDETTTFDDDQLCQVIDDLFLAGSITTSTTLRWAFILMIAHPNIQEKVREEIHNVAGHSRHVSMKDKLNMPYTEAVLSEVQRFGNILVLGVGNRASKDTTVGGYHIPKNTWIFSSLTNVFFDDKYFPDPWSFKPERFLDENGKYKKIEQLIPFHLGKRSCVGESLARMELMLFFTHTLQRYRLKMRHGEPVPTIKHRGLLSEPPEYNIQLEELDA